jgi:hypothetical protein
MEEDPEGNKKKITLDLIKGIILPLFLAVLAFFTGTVTAQKKNSLMNNFRIKVTY